MAKNTKKTSTDQMIEMMGNASGHPVDVCASLVDFIETSEDPAGLLQTVLEYPETIGDSEDDSPQILTIDELKHRIFIYYRYIVTTVHLLSQKNLPEKEFYAQLYNLIFADNKNSVLEQSRADKAVYLEMMANHIKDLPYYALDLSEDITDSDFQDTVKKLLPQLQKTVHIFQRDFEKNSKRGRLLVQQLHKLESEEERVVFMTVLINIIRSKYGSDSSDE